MFLDCMCSPLAGVGRVKQPSARGPTGPMQTHFHTSSGMERRSPVQDTVPRTTLEYGSCPVLILDLEISLKCTKLPWPWPSDNRQGCSHPESFHRLAVRTWPFITCFDLAHQNFVKKCYGYGSVAKVK